MTLIRTASQEVKSVVFEWIAKRKNKLLWKAKPLAVSVQFEQDHLYMRFVTVMCGKSTKNIHEVMMFKFDLAEHHNCSW